MIYFSEGNEDAVISLEKISGLLDAMLEKLGKLDRVLLLPPDYTRAHSLAGEIACLIFEKLDGRSFVEVLPTTGTHTPMTEEEISAMYPGIPADRFRTHDWQNNLARMGTVPAEKAEEMSGGLVKWPVHCEINRILVEGEWDQIISIGQLVPHELIGIANHNKNVLIGTGGKDFIGKTHILGALYGSDRMSGHIDSPVRDMLNHMSRNFTAHLPISYIMTVRATDPDGNIVTRGIFAGDDEASFREGAKLCQKVNITLMDKAYNKVVAYLDPEKFKSVWVGNKALLRTRMCIADGGELIILCKGIRSFGENPFVDAFIRKYGYRPTEELLKIVEESGEMEKYMLPLSQMIISDNGGRFRLTYAAKNITREEIESVGCNWADYDEVVRRYDPGRLSDGENVMPDGEMIFYVPRPAQGLWAEKSRFKKYE